MGDYFQIINRAAGLALNDPTLGEVGPTVNVGTALNVALPDETDFRQLWTMSPIAGSDCYNLINLYTAHAANLSGGAADDYTPIISYTNDGRNTESQNRQWRAEATTEITDSPTTAIAPIEPAEYALAYHPEAHRLHFESATPELLTFEAAVYADTDPNAVIVTNVRHYDALLHAGEAIRRALDGLRSGISGDFVSQDIRECMHYLGEITGEITTHEILGSIFSRFCIGK